MLGWKAIDGYLGIEGLANVVDYFNGSDMVSLISFYIGGLGNRTQAILLE